MNLQLQYERAAPASFGLRSKSKSNLAQNNANFTSPCEFSLTGRDADPSGALAHGLAYAVAVLILPRTSGILRAQVS